MVTTYGENIRLKNGWNDWRGGYLDSNPESQAVTTADYPGHLDHQRDGFGSVWVIESATGKEFGEPVLTNDVFTLRSVGVGFLDTGRAGCNDNLYCSGLNLKRPGVTGQWRFQLSPDSSETVEIARRMVLHLQNARDDWKGGYLDTRGAATGMNFTGKVPLLLCVSTRDGWDGVDSPQTTEWWID
ncbi:hypothetical protein ASD65_18580 [Microbacterium sp. Root61]|uniref:hypothetical protein n=1 Tax=Microbacterium sp. Root61 TaxID=1736570 RepID=UPI0006F9EEEF|nr:hypothetical protein [Microbacterium sp. Root61]KRA22475.1 hypothetical protein ASD65_18580 [Microbacterium sp. Root61]